MTTLSKMWTRLEQHQTFADAGGYGPAWEQMCTLRSAPAALSAAKAAYDTDAATFATAAATLVWAALEAKDSAVQDRASADAICRVGEEEEWTVARKAMLSR